MMPIIAHYILRSDDIAWAGYIYWRDVSYLRIDRSLVVIGLTGIEPVQGDRGEKLTEDKPAASRLSPHEMISRKWQIGQNLQGICVDEETSELSRRDLGQVEWESGLEHADSHTGE